MHSHHKADVVFLQYGGVLFQPTGQLRDSVLRPLSVGMQVAFFCLTPETMIEAGRTKFNADFE